MAKKRQSSKLLGANPKPVTGVPSNPELAGHLVALLNDALTHDPQAVQCLIDNRVPCNMDLANHPTIQTLCTQNGFSVGLLGLLNGLCGVTSTGSGHIVAVYEDDDLRTLRGFQVQEVDG